MSGAAFHFSRQSRLIKKLLPDILKKLLQPSMVEIEKSPQKTD
jgi:hypothetical protein